MKRSVLDFTDTGIKIVPGCEDILMTKHEIARLFDCFVAKVVSNIRVILKSGVLDDSRVYRFHRYDKCNGIELYNMEMIIALAFRIRTHNADLFRKWLLRQAIRGQIYSRTTLFISLKNDAVTN